MASYQITEIWRYPVKSMGGETILSTELGPSGIAKDRRWALRSSASGKIVSAKRPRPYGALLEWSAAVSDDEVMVTAPDGASFVAGAPELDAALTDALGEDVELVRVVEGVEEVYDTEWPEIPGTSLSEIEAEFPLAMMTEKSSFVDVAALQFLVADSMDHLATLVPDVVLDVRRFRPSMVIRAVEGEHIGFAELEWSDVSASAGSAELHIPAPSPRCIMTTLPQRGLGRASGILKALATHAKHTSDFGTYACLGSYAEVVTPGVVSVGDTFRVSA